MKFELWQAFVLGTVLSWGIYVPVLHEGQAKLGGGSLLLLGLGLVIYWRAKVKQRK